MNSQSVNIIFRRLSHGEGLDLPDYASEHAAGLDLRAAVQDNQTILPGERALIPTGFCVEIPVGYEGQVRGRSGLALKHGIGLPNSPGTIDADYRGELGVILINWSQSPFEIHRGDRIAQMIVSPVTRCDVLESMELTDTERGGGGFGHTGISAKPGGSGS